MSDHDCNHRHEELEDGGNAQSPDRRQHRTLTDADVEAIVALAETTLVERFYRNLGRGLWGVIWKVLVMGAIALAAYGTWTEHRP